MAANSVPNSPLPSAADDQHQVVRELQPGKSSVSEGVVEKCSTVNGKGAATRVPSKMAGKSKAKASAAKGTTNLSGALPSFHAFRFQLSLKNGFFTNELKDELLFNLNNLLYQLPSNSFIPSFNGHGLRYGKIWFSPENEESSAWLKGKLAEINEKAVDGCKFQIEPFGLHQNKICLNVPLIPNESLSDSEVLKRLHFQNPALGIGYWKILRAKSISVVNRLIICSIGDCSLKLLKSIDSKLNYGFQKVICKPYTQSKSANSKS